jgi:hypothetical protein
MKYLVRIVVLLTLLAHSSAAQAFSANKVHFERLQNGRCRISIAYTVPALKEFREARIEYSSFKEAEDIYWKLVSGADFYFSSAGTLRFETPPSQPKRW